jgi:hypothetical protein
MTDTLSAQQLELFVKEVQQIPTGTYIAQLTDMQLEHAEFGERVSLSFEVYAGSYGNSTIRVFSSKKLFPGNDKYPPSNLYKAACALLGRKLGIDEPVKLGELINKYCLVEVGETVSKGKTYSNIKNLAPVTTEHEEEIRKIKSTKGFSE